MLPGFQVRPSIAAAVVNGPKWSRASLSLRLVQGHRRRDLPEHLPAAQARPRAGAGAGRRSHLQDGLQRAAVRPRGARRRHDHRLHGSAAGRGARLRRHGRGRQDAGARLPGKARKTRQAIPGRPDTSLASMGIYVFNAAFLSEQLARDAGSTRTRRTTLATTSFRTSWRAATGWWPIRSRPAAST